jgi:predicted glycoside hydrolase/deacetylase ChbG (UPF0249 family)
MVNRRITPPIFLIVNADDCGFYACVSKGVIECAKQKVINATGLMANGPNFTNSVKWLEQVPELDVGVHLNITYGTPITASMKKSLRSNGGVFVPAMRMAAMIYAKKIDVAAIENEWRAQIQRCIRAGMAVKFVNSHEHIHMLPVLYDRLMDMALAFDIPYVRYTRPEWRLSFDLKSHFRNLVLKGMVMLDAKDQEKNAVTLIGTGLSCELNIDYIEACLKTMHPGRVYELMCHPGYFDASEVSDKRLVRYHAWENELRLLTSPSFRRLLQNYNVRLISYNNLTNGLKTELTKTQH